MSDDPTHGVLFDVGYGLCDETARRAAAIGRLSRSLAQHGLDVSSDRLEALYRRVCTRPNPGGGSLLEKTILAAGGDTALAQQQRRDLAWDAEPLTLLPGALDALRMLRAAGLRVGVLANQPASAADDLQRLSVMQHLDDVWLSEAVGLHKPNPAFFRLALDTWRLPAAHVAYVGDRPDTDIAPAGRLGLHTVRLRVGPHAAQPVTRVDERADCEVDSLIAAAEHLIAWARLA